MGTGRENVRTSFIDHSFYKKKLNDQSLKKCLTAARTVYQNCCEMISQK